MMKKMEDILILIYLFLNVNYERNILKQNFYGKYYDL